MYLKRELHITAFAPSLQATDSLAPTFVSSDCSSHLILSYQWWLIISCISGFICRGERWLRWWWGGFQSPDKTPKRFLSVPYKMRAVALKTHSRRGKENLLQGVCFKLRDIFNYPFSVYIFSFLKGWLACIRMKGAGAVHGIDDCVLIKRNTSMKPYTSELPIKFQSMPGILMQHFGQIDF